jgi:cytosine deaminase
MALSLGDVPPNGDFVLANGRAPLCLLAGNAWKPGRDGLVDVDIRVERGRVVAIAAAGSIANGPPSLDLDKGLVLPRLVDSHTHIDKGQIWGRRQNPDGTHHGAKTSVAADREANWTPEDVARRMDFSLRCALAHGTGALRTHIDSLGKQAAISWPVFEETRDAWKGRMALQAVAIFPVDLALTDEAAFKSLVDRVARAGGVLGGITYLGGPPSERSGAAIERVMEAADANGLDLDFHVDESDSLDARSLGELAEIALKKRFRGRIVAGHCCSLALLPDDERKATIARVAEAGVAVVTLPMCNMYLQDRAAGRTPRWRGVAPALELAAAGVPVLIANDNARDPFHAYGDLDLVESFREANRILQIDHGADDWIGAMAARAADALRFADAGRIKVGAPADLLLFSARDWNELNCRPQSDRVVVVGGSPVEARPPDYRELDDLAGLGN